MASEPKVIHRNNDDEPPNNAMSVEASPALEQTVSFITHGVNNNSNLQAEGLQAEGYGCYNAAALEQLRNASHSKQGTSRAWDGVFLPVSLSVFGVVLFIRLPWIVGEAGLYETLAAILVSFCVTFLTLVSIAAISTNGFSGDGGPYMMVARCLGPQAGAAIGLCFVLFSIIAGAMYLIGSSVEMIDVVQWDWLSTELSEHPYRARTSVASLTLFGLFWIVYFRLQRGFRILCLGFTLLAIGDVIVEMAIHHRETGDTGAFTGFSMDTLRDNLYSSYSSGEGFSSMLSILFPGVSGIMSGLAVCGDLKHPKAIPRGIALAWLLSLLTYLAVAFLVAASFHRDVLQNDFFAFHHFTTDYLYCPGEFCACFAVLVSKLGEGRILEVIAHDDLLPPRVVTYLKRGFPYPLIFVYGAMQAIILCGDVYKQASYVTTMVSLSTFTAINLSVLATSFSGVPSFRPEYGFHNGLMGIFGVMACIVAMFLITPLYASISLVLLAALYVLMDVVVRTDHISYGDASQPIFFLLIRKWLLRLDERKEHVRHWRPSILHLVTDPLGSQNLIHFTNSLKKGGLYEIAVVVKGDFESTVKACHSWKGWFLDYISASALKAFALITFGKRLREGVQYMLRGCGVGGMRPNTILLSLDEFMDSASPKKAAVDECPVELARRRSGSKKANNKKAQQLKSVLSTSTKEESQDAFALNRSSPCSPHSPHDPTTIFSETSGLLQAPSRTIVPEGSLDNITSTRSLTWNPAMQEGAEDSVSVSSSSDDDAQAEHSSPKTFRRVQLGGTFRVYHEGADTQKEADLLNQLESPEAIKRVSRGADLQGFDGIEEFVGIVKDIGRLNMNVILARHFDELDTQYLSDATRYIDLWMPREEDPIPFLVAHSLHMSKTWRDHTVLRIVKVVTAFSNVEPAALQLAEMLKRHRIHADVLVIALEEEMARRDLKDLEGIRALFRSSPEKRSEILNSLIARHSPHQTTAVVIVRVDMFRGDEHNVEQSDHWLGNLVDLCRDLPPTLLITGGMLVCRGDEW